MDLYCDGQHTKEERLRHKYKLGWSPAQYTGNNLTECRRDARKDGWRFMGNKAFCPDCAKGKCRVASNGGEND